ncbi:GNAT family N-acetyltransferase [Roseibium sp.]|uniref:GNAT family N-acetyltransferase n=1 Tax=Roseibium sp. TaxID=1936156 RepID=UPI003A977DCF
MQLPVNIRSMFSALRPQSGAQKASHSFGAGQIRLLSGAEKHLFRDHLLRLDAETRRSRFAMHATDAFLRSYVETSFTLDTVIYAYIEDGVVRGTAELRTLGSADTSEAAFCVEPEWRRRGIGTRLMDLLLQSARERNTRHIYINCLATNRRMQALARKFSADMTFQAGDVIGHLSPPKPEVSNRLLAWLTRYLSDGGELLSRRG